MTGSESASASSPSPRRFATTLGSADLSTQHWGRDRRPQTTCPVLVHSRQGADDLVVQPGEDGEGSLATKEGLEEIFGRDVVRGKIRPQKIIPPMFQLAVRDSCSRDGLFMNSPAGEGCNPSYRIFGEPQQPKLPSPGRSDRGMPPRHPPPGMPGAVMERRPHPKRLLLLVTFEPKLTATQCAAAAAPPSRLRPSHSSIGTIASATYVRIMKTSAKASTAA